MDEILVKVVRCTPSLLGSIEYITVVALGVDEDGAGGEPLVPPAPRARRPELR